MADLTVAQLEADPHPLLARLRETEPVAWVPALNGWLVTRRDLALEVMRDAETFTVDDPRFSTGQVVGRSMLTTDGEEHARQRAPFARPFRRDAVLARFSAAVELEVEQLVAAIEPAGRAELRRGLAGPLAAVTMAVALGLEDVGVEAMLGWYDEIVAATSGLSAGRPVSEIGRAAAEELRAAIEARLEGESLVAAAASELSPAEVSSNAAVLLFGGIETTEGMICNALLHLLSHEDQLALVREDRSLLANAIEESLRLEPAAASVDRYAAREVELAGAVIAAGDLVTVSIAAAGRDPQAFDDPDSYDVRRANANRHLAFAAGPHVCIGMHLARLEAELALSRLLDRLAGLRLDPEQPAAPRGLVFRKPPELHVLWDTTS
ncbi:MAG TPA: cytochrome P450 [Thermoleophilaceae bacterium]